MSNCNIFLCDCNFYLIINRQKANSKRKEENITANKNQISKSVAFKASKVLKSQTASKTCKSLAGSALSQTKKK